MERRMRASDPERYTSLILEYSPELKGLKCQCGHDGAGHFTSGNIRGQKGCYYTFDNKYCPCIEFEFSFETIVKEAVENAER